MDLISQPEYLEEAVTDIEVAYLNGVWSRTLRAGDSVDEGRDIIRVITANPPEDNTLFKAQMLGFTIRQRVIKTLVKK